MNQQKLYTPDWLREEVDEYFLLAEKLIDIDRIEATTALDIGANIGAWTIELHRRCPFIKVIHCYEAVKYVYTVMLENLLHEKSQSIYETYNAAVVGKIDTCRVFRRGWNLTSSGFSDTGIRKNLSGPPEKVLQIEARELPAAEIIKIDVEGAELEILEHLPLHNCQLLLVEFHSFRDLDTWLELNSPSWIIEIKPSNTGPCVTMAAIPNNQPKQP